MYGLLASCAAAGVAVVLVGLYAKIPSRPTGGPGAGVWEDPNLNYVKTPSLNELRKSFTPDLCYDSYDLQWKSGEDGQIYVNGSPFFMKGKGRGLTDRCVPDAAGYRKRAPRKGQGTTRLPLMLPPLVPAL